MEEQKTYPAGTVTISSGEYRELVQELTKAQDEAKQSSDKRWEISREHDGVLRQLEELKKRHEELRDFVNADETVKAKLHAYRLEQRLRADEQGECS